MKKYILSLMLVSIMLTGFRFRTEKVYIIVDVVETTETQNGTELDCEMPNGEIHTYDIEDAPEGKITIACLSTENQDDYTVYEVVAVR